MNEFGGDEDDYGTEPRCEYAGLPDLVLWQTEQHGRHSLHEIRGEGIQKAFYSEEKA